METKYNITIQDETIAATLSRIGNQIFKLLPSREEGNDWKTPLRNLMIEITGMDSLIDNLNFFSLLCKMEGLFQLDNEDDFYLFRKTIFECLSIITKIKEEMLRCQD